LAQGGRCLLDVRQLGPQEGVTFGFALVLLDRMVAHIAHTAQAIAQFLDLALGNVVVFREVDGWNAALRRVPGKRSGTTDAIVLREQVIWLLIIQIVGNALMDAGKLVFRAFDSESALPVLTFP